jgi:hypothetical protein
MTSGGGVRTSPGATGGPSRTLEYREAERTLVIDWDPRETGSIITDYFDRWTTPADEQIDDAARERIFESLWAAVSGWISAIIVEPADPLSCAIPVRWDRGRDGFLIDIHDRGQLQYMELGRGLLLSFRRESAGAVIYAHIEWPAVPRWTCPDQPMDADRAALIHKRIAGAQPNDLRIGRHISWKLVFDEAGPR